MKKKNKIKKFTHVYVDLVKIDVGAKIETESKLRGLKRIIFLEDQNHNFRILK